MKMNQINHKST